MGKKENSVLRRSRAAAVGRVGKSDDACAPLKQHRICGKLLWLIERRRGLAAIVVCNPKSRNPPFREERMLQQRVRLGLQEAAGTNHWLREGRS